jgi:large conductance mechanosensitive channel
VSPGRRAGSPTGPFRVRRPGGPAADRARRIQLLKDFRSFVLRGNVVDLAVGVMIGAAFTTVVESFVADMLTPLISLFGGNTNFAQLKIEVGGADFNYGRFINALIALLLTALALFFLVIKPIEVWRERRDRAAGTRPEDKSRPCPECRMEVSKEARRCPFCTTEIGVAGHADEVEQPPPGPVNPPPPSRRTRRDPAPRTG